MGCCVSTKADDKKQKLGSESESCNGKVKNQSRAPPPSLLEEESVKEVLSETPKLPSLAFISSDPDEKKKSLNPVVENIQEAENDFEVKKRKVAGAGNVKAATNTEDAEVVESEVSEICSVSMSESVSTATVNEGIRGEDEEEVRQQNRARLRSPAKLQKPSPASRNRVMGNSPTRRSDPSPGRRNGGVGIGGIESVKMVQGRDASQGIGRRGSMPDPRKKDPGESSGRRSRSPATNRSEMSRSPSTTRTNRSPGVVGSDPTEKSNGKMESKLEPSTDTESLDNPLVSLECFIFL